MNIHFQASVYDRLRSQVPPRQVSQLINQLVWQHLENQKQLEKERIKQSLLRSEQLRQQSSDYQSLQDLEAAALHDYSLTHGK